MENFFPRLIDPKWMNNTGLACVCAQSCPALNRTPWTEAHHALRSLGFSWQEYWSWLSFPPPGDLPDPGIQPESLASPALQSDALSRAAREALTWDTGSQSVVPGPGRTELSGNGKNANPPFTVRLGARNVHSNEPSS